MAENFYLDNLDLQFRLEQLNLEEVVEIKEKCLGAGVPFFFKQWGGTNKKKAGRLLEGRIWDEIPALRHSGR